MKTKFKIILVIIFVGLASTFLYAYHFYEGDVMSEPNESVTIGNTTGPDSMVGDGDSAASIDTRPYGNAPEEAGIAESERIKTEEDEEGMKRTATAPKTKLPSGPSKRL